MNKKLLSIMLVIVTSISLIGVTAIVVVMKYMNTETASAAPSIDKVIEYSVDLPEITTNLSSDNIVRLTLKFETDSKKAREELQKREFQVKDIVISELSGVSADELEGKEGREEFKKLITAKVNELMKDGKVKQVYVTSFILQ
ncbi:flagellar basal body-associated protein FliL [Bacillus lacus]|uniref:Flagellar protein FliL n=1 Tax=Metabacillus lacus TaxID=1983721 RepID=A0A7X2IVM4_9BACI|nr:flagellar basal body-associated protein FliL [Metabacillus lacus]MRX70601.1 flagellar basal body-associated protein FliL [Metabacillus lacus]